VRIRIWGCRGSIAAPGVDSVRYGGNTSCVEVRLDDGTLLILDAGTGIRALGVALVEEPPPRIDLLLTHLHVDHVEGLGAFEPIWRAETELHVWGPASPVAALDSRLATYFSPPLFPLTLAEVPARCTFHDAPEGTWEIDGATMSSQPILHPGPTVGYRIEADGVTLAYLTDHEPALGTDLASTPSEWISGFSLAEGATLLLHDCQYTDEEYESRFGFGHSSVSHLSTFAERAGVDRLLTFHHDPMHTDAELDAIRDDLLERWGVGPERCGIATEGALVEVGAPA
jgi:phosphoribosyl 1,2-cyclic phosphodiesterase